MTKRYIYIDTQYEYSLEIVFTDNIKRAISNMYRKWKINQEPVDCFACTLTCRDKNDKFQI
jgi:hypothetical protein